MSTLSQRISLLAWGSIERELETRGYGILPGVLTVPECSALTRLYGRNDLFRKRIVMEKHGYGQGEYQYFAYPLPEPVASMRHSLYPCLVPLANRWQERLNLPGRFPATLEEYLARCHAAGQLRPTPLMLRYGKGGYNRLHQDLYGDLLFPLQVVFLLSQPGADFSGGEFLLTEQRPRMQSRAEVVPLQQGDAVVFAVNFRPEPGERGYRRVAHRHGVSTLRDGERFTLGIIFHDAA